MLGLQGVWQRFWMSTPQMNCDNSIFTAGLGISKREMYLSARIIKPNMLNDR